jgi:hypothetical protein
MKRPTLFDFLKTALYVGAVGYGGPAILALMKRVIVHEKKWISDEEFMNALNQRGSDRRFLRFFLSGFLHSALDRAGPARSARPSPSRDAPPQKKVPEDHRDQ